MMRSSENSEKKKEIASKLRECSSVAITCHLRPDGDCIGSALGLMLSLRKLGKRADVYNMDPTPCFLKKLPSALEIKEGKIPDGYSCVVFMETSAAERSGQDPDGVFTIHIDHHRTSEEFADINWIEPHRSSVGEMVFELLMEYGFPIDRDIATCLYAAIFSDTGGFRFSNTSSLSLKYASLLVQAGADPAHVSRIILESHKKEEIILLQKMLSTLRFHPSGRVASVFLFRKFLEELGLQLHDVETETAMNILRSVEEVEIVIIFKELEKGFRISLRSKGRADVGLLAESFGGGGHPQAAGFNLNLNPEEALRVVYKKIEEMFPWVKKQE